MAEENEIRSLVDNFFKAIAEQRRNKIEIKSADPSHKPPLEKFISHDEYHTILDDINKLSAEIRGQLAVERAIRIKKSPLIKKDLREPIISL